MPPTKEKRRSKYDTSDVQPAKRAKPAAKREPASERSEPEQEDEHSEPASETIGTAAEAIEEAPIHTMSSDELDAEDLATKSGRYTDDKVAVALGEVRQMAEEFKQEISDEAMVAALTQAEAAHSESTGGSRAGSVNGDKIVDPNETLLRLDPKLNVVYPRWTESDGKHNIYVKVNKYGDRKYLNVNSGKTLKQALAKFGDLPDNSYGVKTMPPFSVITADPLVGSHCERDCVWRFAESTRC